MRLEPDISAGDSAFGLSNVELMKLYKKMFLCWYGKPVQEPGQITVQTNKLVKKNNLKVSCHQVVSIIHV